MAFKDWYPADMTLNRARALCDRAIARHAPVWLPPAQFLHYTITETNQLAPGDEPFTEPPDLGEDALLGTPLKPEEEYLDGLTEAEKAMVRHVSAVGEGRAKYADDLRQWRTQHRER